MKTNMKQRSLRFPRELDEKIQEAAKKGGRSFTDVCIDLLKGQTVVVVEEGAKIAQLLIELRSYLMESQAENKDKINDVLEELVDILYQIAIKYVFERNDHHGNSQDH